MHGSGRSVTSIASCAQSEQRGDVGKRGKRGGSDGHSGSGRGGVGDNAIVQQSVEVVLPRCALLRPEVADNGKAVARFFGQAGNQFVRGLSVVKWRNQRLHDGGRAVVGAKVAPRLQEMRLGQMPLAARAGLVFVQAQVRGKGHFGDLFVEAQFGGRGVDGIAAHNHQHFHFVPPACRWSGSTRSAICVFAGAVSIRAVRVTVVPTLPSASLMA